LQKLFTFAIKSQVTGPNVQANALVLIRNSLGTHYMEPKVFMHHRIGRPNADIQLYCNFFGRHSSVLKDQSPSSSFILYGCGWTTRALCITHTRTAILNISIHSYTTLQEKELSPH
jgi:hypothetical protein